MSKLKTGRLSVGDLAYIAENSHLPLEELAETLQRTPEIIGKYVRLQAGESATKDSFGADEEELNLTKIPFWTDVIAQFSIDERNKILFDWNKMVDQFMSDITYSEQIQIIDMIKFDVLMNRILTEKQDIVRQIKRLEDLVEAEMQMDQDERNTMENINMETSIENLRAGQEVNSRQYKDLHVEKSKLLKELKSTRAQRLTVLENTKENFPQWLQKLMKDPRMQATLGDRLAKIAAAKEQERYRLSMYHTYEDGMVDTPFLTPETVTAQADVEKITNIFKKGNVTIEQYNYVVQHSPKEKE